MVWKVPFAYELNIKINLDVDENDAVSKFFIFLTSNSSWHSVASSEWPQYNPTVLEFKLSRHRYYYPAKTIEYLYASGIEDSIACWTESIKKLNQCRVKFSVGSLADLPLCNNAADDICIWRNSGQRRFLTTCNQRKKGLTFDGHLHTFSSYKHSNLTKVQINLNSMVKEVREEVDVITTSDLIGSVGGSLGMFFGFSFAAYIFYIGNICVSKIVNR